MDTLLELKNLTISFSDNLTFNQKTTTVVKNINFKVEKKSIVAIVGASGAGKSLLAHAILGILPKNAICTGEIIFQDKVLSNQDFNKYRGQEFSLIPQSVNYLDPLLKIKKQLGLKPEYIERAKKLMNDLGLEEDVLELYPRELSGGMARRVLFALSLASESEIILADEPTPGMQASQAVKALSILKEQVINQKKSVILITHDLDLALEFADQIVFLNQGQVINTMSPAQFNLGPDIWWNDFTKQMYHAMPQHEFSL